MSNSDAAHEFSALNTLLFCVIVGLCILAAYLIKRNQVYYLPESAAAIFVGLIVGGLTRLIYPATEELQFLTFEPQLFFFLLLPPIIFEAGYSLKKRNFFANVWTICSYAVFGTLISTFFVGYLVYGFGKAGWINIDTSSPMEALLFGALISAVDPVATLSIMGNPELNCDPLLYSLVFGESVLNDAVVVVLFKTFMSFYDTDRSFSSLTLPSLLQSFVIVSLGSVLIGIAIGLCCSYIFKNNKLYSYPEYEISLLFLFAYGSYALSEALQLSGIMSLFICGIVLSHYNSYNLSPISQVAAKYIFKSLALLSEFFVFLYIGMGLFTGRYKNWNLLFFVFCMAICATARLLHIFPLSFLANLGRRKKIPVNMQVVMWFAGLRGAISFALSQNMPGEHRDLYISTTLSIVIFTTVVCGGLTEPMMKRMDVKAADRVVTTRPRNEYRAYESLALDNCDDDRDDDDTVTYDLDRVEAGTITATVTDRVPVPVRRNSLDWLINNKNKDIMTFSPAASRNVSAATTVDIETGTITSSASGFVYSPIIINSYDDGTASYHTSRRSGSRKSNSRGADDIVAMTSTTELAHHRIYSAENGSLRLNPPLSLSLRLPRPLPLHIDADTSSSSSSRRRHSSPADSISATATATAPTNMAGINTNPDPATSAAAVAAAVAATVLVTPTPDGTNNLDHSTNNLLLMTDNGSNMTDGIDMGQEGIVDSVAAVARKKSSRLLVEGRRQDADGQQGEQEREINRIDLDIGLETNDVETEQASRLGNVTASSSPVSVFGNNLGNDHDEPSIDDTAKAPDNGDDRDSNNNSDCSSDSNSDDSDGVQILSPSNWLQLLDRQYMAPFFGGPSKVQEEGWEEDDDDTDVHIYNTNMDRDRDIRDSDSRDRDRGRGRDRSRSADRRRQIGSGSGSALSFTSSSHQAQEPFPSSSSSALRTVIFPFPSGAATLTNALLTGGTRSGSSVGSVGNSGHGGSVGGSAASGHGLSNPNISAAIRRTLEAHRSLVSLGISTIGLGDPEGSRSYHENIGGRDNSASDRDSSSRRAGGGGGTGYSRKNSSESIKSTGSSRGGSSSTRTSSKAASQSSSRRGSGNSVNDHTIDGGTIGAGVIYDRTNSSTALLTGSGRINSSSTPPVLLATAETVDVAATNNSSRSGYSYSNNDDTSLHSNTDTLQLVPVEVLSGKGALSGMN